MTSSTLTSTDAQLSILYVKDIHIGALFYGHPSNGMIIMMRIPNCSGVVIYSPADETMIGTVVKYANHERRRLVGPDVRITLQA